MRPLLLTSALLAAAAAGPARAASLNVITKIEVKDAGNAVTVSIEGSKAPNFTTFSMADPPRFVVDLSESTFKDVPEDLAVGDGTIQVIKNLSYGSGVTSIARILIAFSREVESPDVQAAGHALVVKIAKAPGAAVAASSAPEAPTRAEVDAKVQADAKAQADALAPEVIDEKARAAATIKAQEDRGRADAEAKARAEAEAKAKAAEAEAEAKAKAAAADAEAKARADAEARAKAEAEEKARAEAEAKARADAEAKARADAETKAKADPKTVAAEEQKGATVEEPRAAAAVPPSPMPEAPAAAPAASGDAATVATVPTRDPVGARVDSAASRGATQVREIGFKQVPGASRVFVRTSATPRFTIVEADERTIRLELANTRVLRHNDTRFLDTSFFPSAVAMVTPRVEGSSYVVEIRLKERVPYQQKIEGDLLAVDFERPAAASEPAASAAASAPAAAAAASAPETSPAAPSRDATPVN